jgi:hypothetical protein
MTTLGTSEYTYQPVQDWAKIPKAGSWWTSRP